MIDTTEYTLVPYTEQDHDLYIQSQIDAFEKYVIEFFGKFNVSTMEKHLLILKDSLFKIIVKNEIAGFVYFKEEDEKIVVDVFTLFPEFRNCGLGTKIMQDFMRFSINTHKPIFVDTFKTNPAKKFYERNSFVVVDENKSHFILKYTPNLKEKNMIDTNLFKELTERGLLYQCTDIDALQKMLESGEPITLYEGTDPTMDSLHIGHCVPYCILRRFQKAGHKVLILMGGATAGIGDPSGRTEMRKLLNKKTIDDNIAKIKETLSVFLDFEGENPAIIVNNADWFKGYDYIDFMREVGVHFNVNKMLSNEIYSNRLEEGGLTFFEMGYMLMQAYDFVHLNREYGCTLQYGGGDQWGNIVAGVELQRKLNFQNGTDINLVGATNPLLLTPEGKKMGKTEKGAIWINKDKISAYDFYQGIYQTPDACVEMMFALFTDLPMDRVRTIIKEDIVKAKKELCYEITKFVRGEEDAVKAREMSENLFTQGGDDAPEFEVEKSLVENGLNICDLLVMTKLSSSKSEGRRLIEGGAISIDGQKVEAFTLTLTKESFSKGSILLKKGKKSFIKVILK